MKDEMELEAILNQKFSVYRVALQPLVDEFMEVFPDFHDKDWGADPILSDEFKAYYSRELRAPKFMHLRNAWKKAQREYSLAHLRARGLAVSENALILG